ncbi:hypothetical protein CAEBREN_09037 [Caenorhabditis brenneri]|uniref:Uncharacterized protein n=1 Tax=Caenorhabditis brenneri TaxID=135651 RepID=G0NWE8_CAEBE|nr:hypothetical protein CAEBREN_09037 [Caenorhabditis brenneri]
MSNSKPLSYPCTKIVLQYLDAGKRFLLSQQAPALYHAEKSVSLKIESLKLTPTTIVVNNHTVELRIIRRCPENRLLRRFQRENEAGGLKSDLDEYGLKYRLTEADILPGDVKVGTGNIPEEEEERDRAYYVDRLVEEKIKRLTTSWTPEGEKIREGCEANIYKLQNRLDNTPEHFERYIRLKISSGDWSKVEYVKYDKKIYEAMKYLTTKFLGGRKMGTENNTVLVRYLEVYVYNCVLRLPKDLNLKARRIQIDSKVTAFKDLFDNVLETHLGLDMVKISTRELGEEANRKHPLITTAKSVIFMNYADYGYPWFQNVLESNNKKVTAEGGHVSQESFFELVRLILLDRRDIGTKFIIGVDQREVVTELFKLIKENSEELDIRGKVVKIGFWSRKSSWGFQDLAIPMPNGAELYIYCVKNRQYKPDVLASSKWKLHFKVVPLNHCAPRIPRKHFHFFDFLTFLLLVMFMIRLILLVLESGPVVHIIMFYLFLFLFHQS